MNKKQIKKLNQVTKAVADVTRLRSLLLLNDGPMPVSAIRKKLKVEPSLLSHHLKILKDTGLIVGKRIGKSITYSRIDGALDVLQGLIKLAR